MDREAIGQNVITKERHQMETGRILQRDTRYDDMLAVLQFWRSGRISWTDMVLAASVAGLFKWRQFEPEVILLAVGWYLRFSLSYRDVEELLAERGLLVDRSTTSPSGGGSNVTPRKFSVDCDYGCDRPTTVGGWTRPTSGSRANGRIYTGLSTPAVRRSTFFSRLNATQQRLSAFSAKPWAEKTIRRRA